MRAKPENERQRSRERFVEQHTPYYLSVGPSQFIRNHTSSVEQIVLIREGVRNKFNRQAKKRTDKNGSNRLLFELCIPSYKPEKSPV